jgi:hypothetical protein
LLLQLQLALISPSPRRLLHEGLLSLLSLLPLLPLLVQW